MIKLFKLASGETVIGDAQANLDKEWVVSRPHTVMIIPHPNGNVGIALVDFIVGAKDDYTVCFKSKDILTDAVDPDINMLRIWDSKMAEILKRDTGIEVISRI